MSDIADFLAARIYEDELAAEKMLQRRRKARALAEVKAKRGILLDYMGQWARYNARRRPNAYGMADYVAAPEIMPLQYLALPYVDHPDYQEWWTPPEPGTVETWGRR